MVQAGLGYTPTPVISHAILRHNRGRSAGLADGVVITPSHNPPEDGGFKYNPPNGGPADTEHDEAHPGSRQRDAAPTACERCKRVRWRARWRRRPRSRDDYITPYVEDLKHVIDMDAIAAAGLKIGVDPMGGAGVAFWEPIAEPTGWTSRSSTAASTRPSLS